MPEQKPLPHQYIAIEGNIGAGKTTLARMMAEDLELQLILEAFADNPFLPYFYENPEQYAFPVELFFLTERHKQLQQQLAQRDLFRQTTVADYFLTKNLLFARNNLGAEEYRLFQRLYQTLSASFPQPDLVVYLHRPVAQLLRHINRRARTYEATIAPEYLERVQNTYFDYFRTQTELAILVIDLGDIDFQREKAYYRHILTLIRQNYEPGVHRFGI